MTVRWTGYELPASPGSYADLIDGFQWRIPASYNIAAHAMSGDPDAVALRHSEGTFGGEGDVRTVSYGELDGASAALAGRLRDADVGRGDRVAVCLPQCPELVVTHLAVLRLGGVVVPTSLLIGDASFAHVLAHSDATALVVDSERWTRADGVRAGAPDETFAVEVDAGPPPVGGLGPMVKDRTPADPPMARTAPDDPAFVLYTSGTTSDPKGVVQGHQYLLGSLPGYHCWFGLFEAAATRRARVWTPSEWAWAGALFDVVFPTLALDGTVVSSVRRSSFDPHAALVLAGSHAVTHAFLPPTALRAIRQRTSPSPADVPTFETVMCGGEHLPASLAEWAETHLGVTVNEAYGQTEANALVGESKGVFSAPAEGIGRPYPGHDVRIVDDAGESVPTGETGEIAVVLPDPVVMAGYLDDSEATSAVRDDGLLRTGDLGRRLDDGTVVHLGRADDLIVTSGYRVGPLEVERVLEAQSSVAAALVNGEPDPERGQRVVATVVPTPDATPDDELASSLQSAVAEALGPYKRPRRVTFVEELPTTRTDKTDRSGDA